MFVTYTNGEEVIVTTKELEAQMLKEYFDDVDIGRDRDDYDREEKPMSDSAVWILAEIRVK